MAGNIYKLNIQNLYSQIKDYYATVAKLNVYGCTLAIKRLPNYWTGKRMNTIIDEYNRVSTSLYDGVVYFQETILGILGEIYEQYVAMENGHPYNMVKEKVSSVSQMSSAKGIKEPILPTSTTNIKFDAANVDKEVKTITSAINDTNATLKLLTSKLDALAEYSDSLKKLVTTYQAKSRTLTANLSTIQSNLLTQVNAAVNAVKTTEGTYNENDVKRA